MCIFSIELLELGSHVWSLVMAEVIVLLNHTLIDALACFEVADGDFFIIQGRE
jgi:hypothetical protein